MTENEAIKRMKYRIDSATDIAGKGVDGKAYEDMEMAIKALEENPAVPGNRHSRGMRRGKGKADGQETYFGYDISSAILLS